MMKKILLLSLLLAGCAQTPLGQRVEQYQIADIATSAAALSKAGAIEANPLMPYLIPVKLYAGKYVETLSCDEAQKAAVVVNTVTGMAIANNLFVLLGASPAWLLGIITGGAFAYFTEPVKCSE